MEVGRKVRVKQHKDGGTQSGNELQKASNNE